MTLVPRPTASVYDANASVFQVGVPAPVTNLSLVRNVPGRTIDLSPPETVEESRSVTMAALRQENVIGSLLARQWESNKREEGYNAWADIEGTAYEPYWDKFVESNNPGYTAALKRQIDMEEEDRRTLASAGGWGILASIGAGVFSPENLLPGGTVYRGVRAGQAALRTGISTATMAVVSTSLAEVALQDSQELRTPLESAFNIGGAAIIGGALGAGISALFTKADYARLGKKFDAEVAEVMQTGGFTPEVAVKVNDEMTKRLVSVGRTAEDAGKEASLYGAFYQTMSKRTGKTVDELLAASPLPEVRGGMTGPDPDGVVYNQDGRIAVETPEFQRWFGESAVRAEDGAPLVVYHGTNRKFDAFSVDADPAHIPLPGIFFTPDETIARRFTTRGREERDAEGFITGYEGARVVPVYLSIRNPAEINLPDRQSGQMTSEVEVRERLEQAKAAGHDGAIIRGWSDGSGDTQYVAFSPTQIKSVNNRGTFDPNDPRILFQPAYHGSPHIFDKFEWSDKTRGKGEGAQAFGDGLYFASRKGLAADYRRKLAGNGVMFPDGVRQQVRTAGDVEEFAIKLAEEIDRLGIDDRASTDAAKRYEFHRSGVDALIEAIDNADLGGGADVLSAARKWLNDMLETRADKLESTYVSAADARSAVSVYRDALAVLDDLEAAGLKTDKGRLYKVEIPDDTDLMDWDAPLSEQPPAVKEALETLGVSDALPDLATVNNIQIDPWMWGLRDDGILPPQASMTEPIASLKAAFETHKGDIDAVIDDFLRREKGNKDGKGELVRSRHATADVVAEEIRKAKVYYGPAVEPRVEDFVSDPVLLAIVDDVRKIDPDPNNFYGVVANSPELEARVVDWARTEPLMADNLGERPAEIFDRAMSGYYYHLSNFKEVVGPPRTGQQIYIDLSDTMGGARMASNALRNAGIPGHRFLDGASRNAGEGTHNYVIYDDSRVAIQSYEQRDPNAFPGDGPRGSIEVGDGSPVIRLFESADRSTFLHETGHFFLESYRMMAGASPDLKGDWDALSAYLEIGADGRVSVAAHEKFARSFEAYLLDGTAPSAALKGAFEQFRDWLVSIYKQIASLNVPINDDVRGIFDRMLATDAEIARARDPLLANEDAVLASIKQAASAGAAARPLETIDENTIAGKAAQVAGGAVRGLNPVLRVLHSSSAATRSIGTRLFENPVYLKKNMQGVASDPSVETLVKEYTQGAMARAMKAANGIYKDYRKAGGQLGRVEFNEAVGKAMRRADEGDDPAISSAAASWRSAVFDPLKDMAIKAGLLPADVSVDTALSYFTRVYNRPMIEAREGEFKGIVRRYIDKSIRDLEFKADEIRIGNQIVDAGKANEKWRQAYDRLTSLDDRLAGRAAVRRRKVEDLNALQQLRFVAQKDRPPAELVKRLRNADENASALGTLRDLRTAERSAGKKLKYHEKYPLLARVKQKGGVKVGSFLDFELRNMGVNPQSHPGLFKSEGGLGAVDNWPWDDDTFFMDNFGRMPDGYLDQNEVLAAIRQEVAGNPLRTPEQVAEDEALDALESNVSAWLDEVGLPSTVNVGEARAFIKRMTGAEKAVDELGLRISKMERDLDTFDEGTESLANQRTISEAEAAKLQEEMNALEEDILEMRQFANASPRVGIIIDYAKAKRDLFKAKLDASRLERRVDALKMVRDDGRMNDALALELAAKTTDLNRVLDRVDTLTKRADKLQPMVPKIRQELPDFVSEADRADYVNQVVDDIFNTLTGRNADADIPREIVAATRGPLKERTFHIPDSEIEEFLESNVEAVARRYARTMAADIELTNAFGKADLKAQIEEIKGDYLRLRAAVANDVDPETDAPLAKPLTAAQKEKEVKRLVGAEKNDIRDIQALRDMVRGAYLARENSTNYARVARVAGTINYLRTMGGVTVSSMTDVARHVMVHGLTGVMRDGLLPMIANLKGFNMAVAEAQVAGAVTDRLLNTRMATWSDITDPYSMSSPFERFMENTANGFSKLNGMVYWNDFQKSFASVITQNRVLRGTMDYGNLDGRERAYLAFLGIDGSMAERIAKQFDTHGTTETGGVRVAHTDDWDDDWARRVYRAAINKDVDSTIITKGVGDIPLFMNTPTGRLLGQFKSFALASHQRALMRGLQERPMGFVSGTMLAATVGMMIYYLKSLEANRVEDVSDNPGRWIAEGLDRSGVFSIAFEANNTIEKAFGIGAYGALAAAFPDAEQSGKASRYSLRSTAAALTGPTGDLIDTAIRAGQAIKGSADGWTEGDVNSVKRLVPGATLPGIRSLVEYLGVPAVKGGLAIN